MELSEKELRELKETVSGLTVKLNEVHSALVGSAVGKDGGLVQRVIDSEIELGRLKDRIEVMENANTKRNTYVSIIWAMGAALGTMIFAYLLKIIFSHS